MNCTKLYQINFSGNFLDSWIDIFTPVSSELEYKLCAFGKSISNILTHCWEEFQTTFVLVREATELLNNISQKQNLLSCTEILQHVTKLKSGDVLSSQTSLWRWFPVLLKSLTHFENVTSSIKGCNAWMVIIKSLIEKYSYSHFENAKDVLILLSSLGTFSKTDNIENIRDILHMTFKLAKYPCLQNITTAHLITNIAKYYHCTSDCVSVVLEYLKLILPTFSDQDDLQIIDFILTLFNYTDGEIENTVQKLTGSYAPESNHTMFSEAPLNSSAFPNFLQLFWSSSVESLREIQTLLNKLSSENLQNGSFPWHSVLKALKSLQQYSLNFLKEHFQHLVHYFKDTLLRSVLTVHNMIFHRMINLSNIDVELLIRDAFRMLRSYGLHSSPGVLGEGVFLKHLITLLQKTEHMDGGLLVEVLRELSKSLSSILVNVSAGQYAGSSELNKVARWFDSITSFPWNSTGMWRIMQLFQEADLTEIMQIFHKLPEAVSLLERIVHKNITGALIDVYQFMLNQNTNMAGLSKEELFTGVNSFLELLDPETGITQESTNALRCLAAVICWNITTTTSWACGLDVQNDSLSIHDMAADFHKQFTPKGLQRKLPCSKEHFLKEVTYKMACFLHQLEQWHPIISKFSKIYQGNSSVLNELLGLWNKLSNYAVTANSSNLTHCILFGKKHTSLQLIEALSNMTSSEITAAKALFAQFADLYGDQNTDMESVVLRIKSIFTNLNIMTNHHLKANATEDNFMSFFSAILPLITLSPARNKTYMVLKALLTLARNGSLKDNLETLWLETEREIENLMSNFNIRHLLSVIDKEIQLLSTATGQNILMSLASILRSLNALFLETPLKNFEDILVLGEKRLSEYSNKYYSKIINALVPHMAGKKSPNEILQTIKDIPDFLGLLRNGTQEDDPISFITDFLSGKKLKNVQITHSILQNSLLNVIYDLASKEEFHFNDSNLQIMEFIDLFFDHTQYENYRKDITPSQSRTMELIKEVLQVIFPSSTEHCRNKIFFLTERYT